FSSRRRHTRSKRDWSSDVCSSDLDALVKGAQFGVGDDHRNLHQDVAVGVQANHLAVCPDDAVVLRYLIRGGHYVPCVPSFLLLRSEERRVGKEGSGGGAGDRCSYI